MEESKIIESEDESDEEMKQNDYQEEDLSYSSLNINDTYRLISEVDMKKKQREKERE